MSEPIDAPTAESAVLLPKAKDRFINFRVSEDEFVSIKTAALISGMSLGEYFLSLRPGSLVQRTE